MKADLAPQLSNFAHGVERHFLSFLRHPFINRRKTQDTFERRESDSEEKMTQDKCDEPSASYTRGSMTR